MRSWIMRLPIALMFIAVGCTPAAARFDGQRALAHVKLQVGYGPRPVGSAANRKTADYVARNLKGSGWRVEYEDFAHRGLPVRNVVGKKGTGPVIILGTHYDTRPLADNDPTDRSQPVPGANDGASGVAVLLELARVLDRAATDRAEIWLAFFDAEDRGELNDWEWCVGSGHMADGLSAGLTPRPAYAIIVDMVGDQDQQIYYEWTSALWLQERVWGVARRLGYAAQFVPQHRYSIYDDHSSFMRWGVPSALVIDFDYDAWHTRYDTLDKIGADSLQRVGDVLETLLEEEPFAASVSKGTSLPTSRP